MAERFTGFVETGRWVEPGEISPGNELVTTIGPMPVDELLERMRVRLEAAEPGTMLRAELIAWGE